MKKALTGEILDEVSRGWRVGVETGNGILVYEVYTRIGDTLRGNEIWIFYPKGSKIRGGGVENEQIFVEIRMKDVCYAYLRQRGSQYLAEDLMDKYEL